MTTTLAQHFLMVPLTLFTMAVPLPFGALGVSEGVGDQLFKLVGHPSGALAMMGFRVLMYGAGLVWCVRLPGEAQGGAGADAASSGLDDETLHGDERPDDVARDSRLARKREHLLQPSRARLTSPPSTCRARSADSRLQIVAETRRGRTLRILSMNSAAGRLMSFRICLRRIVEPEEIMRRHSRRIALDCIHARAGRLCPRRRV